MLQDYKYYRVYVDPDEVKGQSPLSSELHSITEYFPEDYIPPVTRRGGDLIELISDESKVQSTLSVSLVIMPVSRRIRDEIESELERLVKRYGMTGIHFVEIFGRARPLGNKLESFLDEYCGIVSSVTMSAVALVRERDRLLLELGESELDKEMLLFQLFWNNFERILNIFKPFSVLHIWWEQDNNTSQQYCERLIARLHSGISEIERKGLNSVSISLCKHPQFFSKRALFYSSVSDLAAHVANKMAFAQAKGVPDNKILADKKRALMLRTLRNTFKNYAGLPCRELIDKA